MSTSALSNAVLNAKAKSVAVGFVYTAGSLLLVTATAKFISALGDQMVLQSPMPLLRLSFRSVFLWAASIETVVGLVCLFHKHLMLQTASVACLATSFLVYRFSLAWLGYHMPCSCLGNLTATLAIPPQEADAAMKIILGYLLVGSYGSLFWQWRQRCKTSSAPSAEESAVPTA